MKITVATQAYNAKKFIAQCIESVLNQTYTDFEFILVDNGCNDGSEEIIRKYAEQDDRIKLVRYDENVREGRWYTASMDLGTGDYITQLDADDWLEPDFLERLVHIAETTDSDIVATGTVMHIEGTNRSSERRASQRLVLNNENFADGFTQYHALFRTSWGKLIRMEIVRNTHLPTIEETDVSYGNDTLVAFSWLRNCKRICIDNSALHHYRINSKSVSHQYDPRQSFSDVYLFNDAVDFLSAYGPISSTNMTFLYIVYSNAIRDTSENIISSTLSPAEKLREYRKILTRQLTKEAYKINFKDVTISKKSLLISVLKCACELDAENDDLEAILSVHLPMCSRSVSTADAKLFLTEKSLIEPLLNDDCQLLVKNILSLISKQMYVKQYDLGAMLCRLAYDKQLLQNIKDTKFLRRHSDIYLMVWQEKYGDALVAMTEYLQLYLSLAAVLECANEFIFGKIKAAVFYFSEKRFDECRTAVNDLDDMGVEDTAEIAEIKKQLNSLT